VLKSRDGEKMKKYVLHISTPEIQVKEQIEEFIIFRNCQYRVEVVEHTKSKEAQMEKILFKDVYIRFHKGNIEAVQTAKELIESCTKEGKGGKRMKRVNDVKKSSKAKI
jgi:hypothetical protein